jgi:hypothetical protein
VVHNICLFILNERLSMSIDAVYFRGDVWTVSGWKEIAGQENVDLDFFLLLYILYLRI